jgi:hypothetical protein
VPNHNLSAQIEADAKAQGMKAYIELGRGQEMNGRPVCTKHEAISKVQGIVKETRQAFCGNEIAQCSDRAGCLWWEQRDKSLTHAHVRANRVWRVEFRAGKDLLKDRWGIRTWQQFFDRFGDLCREAGEVVRYVEPDMSDPNRARWPNHMIWDIVCAEMNDDLTEMRSGADPNPMKEVHREEHIAMLFRNLLGSSITLGALRGSDADGLADVFDDLAANMNAEIKADPERAAKQLQDAKDRYVFIKKRKPPT